ncbi:hypothetical protein [Serratia plymuthica]|uniref:hypothetical protein n=1 Tax=Serratia plymuthica TaxID=82996 RepID=UPI00055DAF76|nr:hypothetical protein [Serratia plymuthica]
MSAPKNYGDLTQRELVDRMASRRTSVKCLQAWLYAHERAGDVSTEKLNKIRAAISCYTLTRRIQKYHKAVDAIGELDVVRFWGIDEPEFSLRKGSLNKQPREDGM